MSDREQLAVWRGVEAAAVIIVLGFFLYATRTILNPVLLFVLLWAVLIPFRGREGHNALLIVAAVLTVFWLLSSAGSILAPFILSIVLAYVLDPVVDWLESKRTSRMLAIGFLSVFAVGLLAVVVLLLLPAAVRQLGAILNDVPVFFQRLGAWVETMRTRMLSVDMPFIDEDDLAERLGNVDGNAVMTFLQERREALGSWVWTGALGLGRGIGSVFTVIGYVALTPILTFYLLRDWDMIMRVFADLIPNDDREGIVSFARECDAMIARYMRGQVTVAITLGILTALGLWLVRFPHAGLLGLIVGIFNVVPYLGLVLSLVPAVFIALVSGAVGVSLLKVLGVYGVCQLLDGSVISPRVVGDSVGLHPVSVLLALSLGSFFFGFVGLLIGVPLAAVIKLLLARGIARYKASALYRGSGAAAS
jgi:predicted PurR-regulated permease PerM